MIRTLIQLLRTGSATQTNLLPDLPEHSRGLPRATGLPCSTTGCEACATACPTGAVALAHAGSAQHVTLDLGRCLGCGACTAACPSGALIDDRRTRVAVRSRSELVQGADAAAPDSTPDGRTPAPFRRSIHIREVSTGDNATDLEANATNNPIFDSSRFGIHFVASPRFADALLVTGPVGRAMQEPLKRCYEAMAEPRIVIAAGAAAISGGLHGGGYASADGVDAHVPVSVYVPGNPPHPWYLLHGILLAMGHPAAR